MVSESLFMQSWHRSPTETIVDCVFLASWIWLLFRHLRRRPGVSPTCECGGDYKCARHHFGDQR